MDPKKFEEFVMLFRQGRKYRGDGIRLGCHPHPCPDCPAILTEGRQTHIRFHPIGVSPYWQEKCLNCSQILWKKNAVAK